jgi:small conductance mechanosensitive channel
VNAADYWGVHFDLHAAVKTRFDEEGIGIPYPQRDVHLYQQEASAK